jgi:hypothetical protein
MTSVDPNGPAELIESIHQPWKASVSECLHRWRALAPAVRDRSYLVVEMDARRRTLNAGKIAELAARTGWA